MSTKVSFKYDMSIKLIYSEYCLYFGLTYPSFDLQNSRKKRALFDIRRNPY